MNDPIFFYLAPPGGEFTKLCAIPDYKMHSAVVHPKVLWYDSVTKDG